MSARDARLFWQTFNQAHLYARGARHRDIDAVERAHWCWMAKSDFATVHAMQSGDWSNAGYGRPLRGRPSDFFARHTPAATLREVAA